jgi:hypothetical protein
VKAGSTPGLHVSVVRLGDRFEEAGAGGGFLACEREEHGSLPQREGAAAVSGLDRLGCVQLRDVEPPAGVGRVEDLEDATVERDHGAGAQA